MINKKYQLIEPKKIAVSFENISLDTTQVLVRPTYLSICVADERYFMGTREESVLKKKLPMSLIHEATGEVIFDKTGEFKIGDKVIMIPNTPAETDADIAENYLPSSKFRASGFDGFMQEYVAMDRNCLVKCNDIKPHVAAVSELLSVAAHAVDTFDKFSHNKRDKVGIWGDGNLAYMIAAIIAENFPEIEINVFGANHEKMTYFSFADNVYHINDIPKDMHIDHAFECVGGINSASAISQIIDYINPEGTVMLLGVSENPVPIETRMVLEKGLKFIGRSRSGKKDFEYVVDRLTNSVSMQERIAKILNNIVEVNSIEDVNRAFGMTNTTQFKIIMKWNI